MCIEGEKKEKREGRRATSHEEGNVYRQDEGSEDNVRRDFPDPCGKSVKT